MLSISLSKFSCVAIMNKCHLSILSMCVSSAGAFCADAQSAITTGGTKRRQSCKTNENQSHFRAATSLHFPIWRCYYSKPVIFFQHFFLYLALFPRIAHVTAHFNRFFSTFHWIMKSILYCLTKSWVFLFLRYHTPFEMLLNRFVQTFLFSSLDKTYWSGVK